MDQEYGAYVGKRVSVSDDDKALLLTMGGWLR